MVTTKKPSDILTFLIIGAQKSGTTWLYDVLEQHPDIFLPAAKELHFYNRRDCLEAGHENYLANFVGAESYRAVGEATPNYLSGVFTTEERGHENQVTNMPGTIHADLPDISLVVSLRNPVSRAISAFHHLHTRALLPANAKLRDCANTFGIVSFGFYAEHLKRWYEYYPEERVCVLIFENDIIQKASQRQTIDRVCAHLGVPPLPPNVDLNIKSNEKLEPAMAYLNRLPFVQTRWRAKELARDVSKRIPRQIQNLIEPKITQADKDFLEETFAPHNEKLEKLLGINLPW
ncbi:MAG: sulfotransferase domain-containing protein [Pseudomonadota bacterium]